MMCRAMLLAGMLCLSAASSSASAAAPPPSPPAPASPSSRLGDLAVAQRNRRIAEPAQYPLPAALLPAVAPPATLTASALQQPSRLDPMSAPGQSVVEPAAAAAAPKTEPRARLPEWVNPDNAFKAVGLAVGGSLTHRFITRPRDMEQVRRRIEWRDTQLMLLNEYIDEDDPDYSCIAACVHLQLWWHGVKQKQIPIEDILADTCAVGFCDNYVVRDRAWQQQIALGKRQPADWQRLRRGGGATEIAGAVDGALGDDERKGTSLFGAGAAVLQQGVAAMKREGLGAAAAAVMARFSSGAADGGGKNRLGGTVGKFPVKGRLLK